MISKISIPALLLILASFFLSSTALSHPSPRSFTTTIPDLKPTQRMPAQCSAPNNVNTGLCICFLNFSDAPQFSFYTQAELNAGRQTCLARFGSRNSILSRGSACDRFRQNPPNRRFVKLFYLLSEGNRLIRLCAPAGVPLLRLP